MSASASRNFASASATWFSWSAFTPRLKSASGVGPFSSGSVTVSSAVEPASRFWVEKSTVCSKVANGALLTLNR